MRMACMSGRNPLPTNTRTSKGEENMSLKEASGHVLNVGDKVKMNIPVIAEGEMDGVEYTASGKNYWRYTMSQSQPVVSRSSRT